VATTTTSRRRPESTGRFTRQQKFTRQQIETADAQLVRAFALLGLVSEDILICPICHTAKRGKVQIKTSNTSGREYWTCHKCPDPGSDDKSARPWGGSAIDLLKTYGDRSFRQAVEELLGLRDTASGTPVIVPDIQASASFQASVDVEVYDHIRDAGSLEAAQRYYSRWHIAPAAVAEAGLTVVEEPDQLHRELVETYGLPRLRACGVVTADRKERDVFLFNRHYPVIEVHQAPSGHVVGMQFRPSLARLEKVAAHKAWKRRWSGIMDEDGYELAPAEAWSRAYAADPTIEPKAAYVTPFLSLKGGGPDHLVGGGLKRLVEIPAGSTVYAVEGIKDLLAARTMGAEAYAVPGTGVQPPARSMQILKRHHVVVMLDGDAAGARGRQLLVELLREHGVHAEPASHVRDNLDITDLLVERTAHAGCTCQTCDQWVADHPYDPATCVCRTCRRRRQ